MMQVHGELTGILFIVAAVIQEGSPSLLDFMLCKRLNVSHGDSLQKWISIYLHTYINSR